MKTSKAAFVHSMFSRIAPYYDLMNRLISFSLDQRWRKELALWAPNSGLILDLAAGTGDSASAFLQTDPQAKVVALDFCEPMLRRAIPKLSRFQGRAILVQGDAMELPFASSSFDGAISAFAMRNLSDLQRALGEIFRVLKPEGFFLCLEISYPNLKALRLAFSLYFGRLVPLLGQIVAHDAEAYSYLPSSVAQFLPPEEFAHLMEGIGFRQVEFRRLFPGMAVLHRGFKP